MPNRIIKESAFESDKIAGLSDFQFRLWVGLITQADDKGHGDARPAIIKGRLFSLRERVTIKDVDTALQTLAAAGCVSLYQVGERPYYEFPNWTEHQYVKNVKPKYPLPEDGQYIYENCQNSEIRRNSEKDSADCSSNTIQYNTNTNTNRNTNTNVQRESDPSYEAEFADAWSLYPKKQGKENAFKAYVKARKEGIPEDTIFYGIHAYLNYIKLEKVEDKYIKMGSTWFNQRCWEDDYSVKRKPTTLDIADSIDLSDF